ncbi:unnamed protein product [Closterium sp. NIES-65]|nr:unnamed protein product [Closterium sp. NIES-65]
MRGPSDQISVSLSETPALQPNSASATPAGVPQPSALPSAAPPGARLIPLRGASSARSAESPYAIVRNSTATTQSASATRFVPLRLPLGKLQHQQQRREVEGATDIANQGGPILAYSKEYLIYYGTSTEGSGQDVTGNFENSLGGDTETRGSGGSGASSSRAAHAPQVDSKVKSLGGDTETQRGIQGDPTGESSGRIWWDMSTNSYQTNDDGSQPFVSPEVMLGGPVTDDSFNGWESIDGTFTDDGSDGWESSDYSPIYTQDTYGIYLVLVIACWLLIALSSFYAYR